MSTPQMEAPGKSSFPLPQSEGEYDQGQANHHREDTDKRCYEWHVGTGQDRKDRARRWGHPQPIHPNAWKGCSAKFTPSLAGVQLL
jgi:hypothetical protein